MNEKKKVYEVGFIIVPTISHDHVSKEIDGIHNVITKNGGDIISEEVPKTIRLAYEMSKTLGNKKLRYDTGHFGWVKFYGTEEGVIEVKKYFDTQDNILRSLIIKTVAENTLYGHKIMPEKANKPERAEDNRVAENTEEKGEINQEELDKSIDKLVIE